MSNNVWRIKEAIHDQMRRGKVSIYELDKIGDWIQQEIDAAYKRGYDEGYKAGIDEGCQQRLDEETILQCPFCEQINRSEAKYCSSCGKEMPL